MGTPDKIVVSEECLLQLSEEQQRRWALKPGAKLVVQETPDGLLLRPADPPLSKVYVEPTSKCNLMCRTCVRNSWDEPMGRMEMATYQHLIEGLCSVPSLQTVSFWGIGEPLLHPNIAEMVALAKGLGAKTEIVTNGFVLNRKMAEALVSSSLDTIIFSVDGASPESFSDVRCGANLAVLKEKVGDLRAVRSARNRRTPEIGLQFVVMKRNVGELANLRALARDMEATLIIVSNVLPYTEELSREILYWLWAGSSYQRPRSQTSPELVLPRFDARREVLEPLVGLLEHTWLAPPPARRAENASGYCRFVNDGAVAVGWNGEVSPCVPLMHSYSCYIRGRPKRFRRYVLGNVNERSIADLWNSQEYVRFRERLQEFDFPPCTDCAGCELAESNEEDCFGNTFPTCGDCLWAKGVVHCP